MNKYGLALLMLVTIVFFAGCDDKWKVEDGTDRDVIVSDSVLRKGLVVVSAKKIPQTDLAEIVAEHKEAPYCRFKLITSQSAMPQKGDSVDVVRISYYINSDEVPGTWRNIFAVKKDL